jgi:hypothetical protein
LKFKGFCFKFIFNLNVVFTTQVLKVAPIHVRDFLQEQDFTESNLIRTDHVGKHRFFVALEVCRSIPLLNANTLEQPPWKRRRFFTAPAWR